MSTKTLMTGAEMLRLPRGKGKCELVLGVLYELPPPGGEHGERSVRIGRILDDFVEAHQLGRVGVESGFYTSRNPDSVRGPDAFFISKDRLDPDIEVPGYYEVVPDLVVEVLSPGESFAEVMEKVEEYLGAGVRLVWLADTRRRTIVVHPGGRVLHEGETLTGEIVLPGFAVPVERLFRRKRGG
ncbi:MAG: Uma2 family endonuclease [Planctomycetes bacterium]|nr:Uma2 family endonuclease [Planctomycetota bacterium]